MLKKFYIYTSIGVSSSGKTAGFDSAIRWFESSYPNKKGKLAKLEELCN